MIKYFCNRCGREVSDGDISGVLHLSVGVNAHEDPYHATDVLENQHFCLSCTEAIRRFIQNEPETSQDESPETFSETCGVSPVFVLEISSPKETHQSHTKESPHDKSVQSKKEKSGEGREEKSREDIETDMKEFLRPFHPEADPEAPASVTCDRSFQSSFRNSGASGKDAATENGSMATETDINDLKEFLRSFHPGTDPEAHASVTSCSQASSGQSDAGGKESATEDGSTVTETDISDAAADTSASEGVSEKDAVSGATDTEKTEPKEDCKPASEKEVDAVDDTEKTEGASVGKSAPEKENASDPKRPESPAAKTGKKSRVDKGKILALRRAGWKYKDIADEVHLSPQYVANIVRAELQKTETN